ncbi:hypothetical protein MMC27_002998 [Xylographa pallens]|nr:hypothetical protein [Xylographa pallens]
MSPPSPSPPHLSSRHPSPPSPPSPLNSPELRSSTYTTLTSHLHTHRLSTLSLEILPSSSCPTPIQHDNLNLAISKSALIHTFLTAREIFLSHLPSPPDPTPTPLPYKVGSATKIILLYDPEHLSAANWRKRRISQLASHSRPSQENDVCGQDASAAELRLAVHEEWAFLTSLLTSPLHRHAKSATLWWHRCWLVRNYIDYLIPHNCVAEGSVSRGRSPADGLPAFLRAEMDVILQAAERHKANYHAFHYGRRLLRLYPEVWGYEEKGEVVEKLRRWCFAHPRDGSGWGFLAFLLRHDGLVMDSAKRKGLIGKVSHQTREFVAALRWKGESLEWFLREMDNTTKQADAISMENRVGGIG